jgi:hypothetical protein
MRLKLNTPNAPKEIQWQYLFSVREKIY